MNALSTLISKPWKTVIEGIPLVPWRFRRVLLKTVGVDVQKTSYVAGRPKFGRGKFVVGEHGFINVALKVYGAGDIIIGNNVFIGPNVTFMTGTHEISSDNRQRADAVVSYGPIIVRDGSAIGGMSTILGGVVIEQGCVIGAGSVVMKNTKPNSLYVGVPARWSLRLP